MELGWSTCVIEFPLGAARAEAIAYVTWLLTIFDFD